MSSVCEFLSPDYPSLKVCGVTCTEDAEELVEHQVPAVGINFWPPSKRYCEPEVALQFLPSLAGKITRVGVFVNNAREVAPLLLEKKALDVIQLHGDEDEAELHYFLESGIPVIRSLALKSTDDLATIIEKYRDLAQLGTLALLLDTHAPGQYGGTGQTIDWQQAAQFIAKARPLPVLLAGGIVPANAAEALRTTRPTALDVASGAEHSPGKKAFQKVAALQEATRSAS